MTDREIIASHELEIIELRQRVDKMSRELERQCRLDAHAIAMAIAEVFQFDDNGSLWVRVSRKD